MKLRDMFFLFLTVMSLAARADDTVKPRLLTDNGRANPAFSEYKKAPFLVTGGTYRPVPRFVSAAKNTPAVIPFALGALTNGDSTFAWKRKPGPYSYWQRSARGEVEFDLKKNFRIQRVRIRVLNSGPHGTAGIELFKRGDPLEFPDLLKLGRIKAKNGWNEFSGINTLADGIRLRFTAQPGKAYITISEIEIWGTPAPAGAVRQAPRKLSGKSIREKGIEWYAFDFGPASAPTFANFTGVSKDVVYTGKRGYGWLPYRDGKPAIPSNFGPESKHVPGLGDRDRGSRSTTISGSLYRDFVTSCKYYHTQVRQTFVLDVPNGMYRVMTFHGDERYGRAGRQSWWLEAEGKRVVSRPLLPTTRRMDVVFEVPVADGQLTLTFDSDDPDPVRRGFGLNGLVVLPVANARERAFAKEKIARIRAAIKREQKEIFEAIFVERPYVETAEMPPVSAADKDRGFVPFVPNWMRNIYPVSVPRPAEIGKPAACFACRGEYEPLTVAVRALRDLKDLSCVVSDLQGPGTIPAAAMDVRVVRCWPQRLGSSWSTEWRVMPELLEHKSRVDVPADTAGEFWLTLRVPDDAAPGRYRGVVTLRAGNAGNAQIPLEVEILPFRLQKNDRPVGMYWYEKKVIGTPLRDKQVRDMVAHGMTTLTMGQLFPEIKNVNGRLVLDTTPLLSFLQDLKRLGIDGPIPYHNSALATGIQRAFPGKTPAEYDALYVEAIRRFEAVSSRADTPKLLYYPVDEIGGDDKRGKKAHDECALIAKVPGATSYITVNNYKGGEKWGDTFAIWCGNIAYKVEQENPLLARKKRYMRYGSAYLNDPRKARNSCGFGFYRRPAEAMFYWHYQATIGDPYNDFDGGTRDWCAVYPGPDNELIPTTDWEGLREGVDDLRYIATLRQAADQAAGKPETRKAAARARAVLADILQAGKPPFDHTSFAEELTNDQFQGLRRKLVDAILELRTAPGGQEDR
jgi:hypothetical protein